MTLKLNLTIEIDYSLSKYKNIEKEEEVKLTILKAIQKDIIQTNMIVGKFKSVKFEDKYFDIVYTTKLVKK